MKCSHFLLLVVIPLFVVHPGRAQSVDDPLTIRVEASRVLVPVTAIHYSCREPNTSFDPNPGCFPGGDVDYEPCNKMLLSAKDFRLYEDGVQQKIDGIEVVRPDSGVRHDNLGFHIEESATPKAIGSTRDAAGLPSFETCPLYMIAYKPPATPVGTCHKIRVKVAGNFMQVDYRDQYCNIEHSSSDPAGGLPIEKKLEQYIAYGKPGTIHPRAKAQYFYTTADKARVHVDIEFPVQEVEIKKCSDEDLPLNILIIASERNGSVVARQSEFPWAHTNNCQNTKSSVAQFSLLHTVTRYDAQMELPPGEYNFDAAVSFGDKFGITEVPLTIDPYDGKQVAISSIALCKRFRQAGQPSVAKDFVPLISQNYEFSPAADHVFRPGDSVMAYFELYRPVGAVRGFSPIRFHMNITNTKTGAVAMDAEMSADQWMKVNETMIPVSLKLVLEKLVAGEYKLEIQAWDSAGNATPWRMADFLMTN